MDTWNKMVTTLSTTLAEVKKYLFNNYEKGCICPACNQTVKLYKRQINQQTARFLVTLYHLGYGYHDYRKISNGKQIGDFPKLKHWGLIEKKPNTNEGSKKSSGQWRITELGKNFVEGKVKISQYIHLYNNRLQGLSGKNISFEDVLGQQFHYESLLNRA